MTDKLTGVEQIAIERLRQQTEEGYDAAHDAEHVGDDLALAAACYALPPYVRGVRMNGEGPDMQARLWPSNWDFKPVDRVRDLVKAGALIAAEIDSLQRRRA